MEQIYGMLGISPEVEAFGEKVLKDLKERFEKIDVVAEYNQAKVLALCKNIVSAQNALLAPLAMVIMIRAVKCWNRCMRQHSIQKQHWFVRRLHAVPTLWQLPFPRTCCPEMNCFLP